MQFREKLDKVLMNNTLDINTIYGLEKAIKASPGSISKYLNKPGNKTPGKGTIKKIIEGLGISKEWWESGKGDIFVEKECFVDETTNDISKQNAKISVLLEKQLALLEKENARLEKENEELKNKVSELMKTK